MTEERQRHSEALLGMHLAEGRVTPRGAPPEDEELALLAEGRLQGRRREEVLTHLIADPARYRQWLNLVAMADDTAPATSSRAVLANAVNRWVGNWRYAAGAVGAVAATLMLAIYTGITPPVNQRPVAVDDAAEPSRALKQRETERERMKMAPPPAGSEVPALSRPELMTERAPALEEAPAAPQADMAAPEPIEQCAALGSGRLCVQAAMAGDGSTARARWQWRGADDASPRTVLTETLEGRPAALRLSPDGRWLAIHLVAPQHKRLLVRSVPGLLGEGPAATHYLGMLSPVADFRWEDGILRVEYREPAREGEPDAVSSQRFDPESGEFEQ